MSQGALKGWIRLYNAFGFEGLRTSSQASRYFSVLKQATVNDYLNGKYTAPEILKNIKSGQKLNSEDGLRSIMVIKN